MEKRLHLALGIACSPQWPVCLLPILSRAGHGLARASPAATVLPVC